MMNYKIVFVPSFQIPAKFEQEFESIQEAIAALDAIANYTLFLHKEAILPDYSNAGFLMMRDRDRGWIEVDEDENEI